MSALLWHDPCCQLSAANTPCCRLHSRLSAFHRRQLLQGCSETTSRAAALQERPLVLAQQYHTLRAIRQQQSRGDTCQAGIVS